MVEERQRHTFRLDDDEPQTNAPQESAPGEKGGGFSGVELAIEVGKNIDKVGAGIRWAVENRAAVLEFLFGKGPEQTAPPPSTNRRKPWTVDELRQSQVQEAGETALTGREIAMNPTVDIDRLMVEISEMLDMMASVKGDYTVAHLRTLLKENHRYVRTELANVIRKCIVYQESGDGH